MKKIHIIIFTTTLILIVALCFIYIEFFIPYEDEHILYATTDAHQIIDFWPSVDIQIDKNGEFWLQGKSVNIQTIGKICSHLFSPKQYGPYLPINLHVEKDAEMRQVKPIIDTVLKSGGYSVRLVAKRDDHSFHYFCKEIDPKNFNSKYLFELSQKELKLNGKIVNQSYLDNLKYSGDLNESILYCNEEVSFQRLVDILPSIRCTQLKIGKVANEVTPLDQNSAQRKSGK
jgi:biopolymer transport protein ExbD